MAKKKNNNKKKEIELEYKVKSISTSKFVIADIPREELEVLFDQVGKLEFRLNVKGEINKKESTLSVVMNTFLYRKDNKEDILIEHSADTTFLVKGLTESYIEDKGMFNIPDSFLMATHAIAFSHARALLSVNLSSTNYNGLYNLPILNPADLIGSTN